MRRVPSTRVRVLATRLLLAAAGRLLGAPQACWARAMRAEVAAIDDERAALAFAWGCLRAAFAHALVSAPARLAQPQPAGVLAGSAAVLLGSLCLHAAGAPVRWVGMNLLSLAFALATFWLLPRARWQQDAALRARLAFALGALLLAGSLGGAASAPSAWWRVGPVSLNGTWLLLPALLVAADPGPQPVERRWALGGLLMAFGALALQAEVPMAGLAAGVLALRAWRRRSGVLALLAVLPLTIALHAAPAWQPPAAQAFVDRVVQHGFAQHPALGGALLLLQLLPLAPALLQRRARGHGLVWGLVAALGLVGWLPSALVGFGGSFIVGYLLSLALLPGDAPERPARGSSRGRTGFGPAPPPWLRAGL